MVMVWLSALGLPLLRASISGLENTRDKGFQDQALRPKSTLSSKIHPYEHAQWYAPINV